MDSVVELKKQKRIYKYRGGGKRPALTYKRKMAVVEFLKTGNQTEAVVRAYGKENRNVAKSMASEIFSKPDVRALINEYASEAVENIKKLGRDAQSEKVRLDANTDMADRAGFKAVDRVETTSIIVNLAGTLGAKRSVETLHAPQSAEGIAPEKDVPVTASPEQNAV